MLLCEDVTSVAGFLALREEWNDLLRRSGRDEPCLRHEWLEAWWSGFGEGNPLEVLTVRDGGRLIGAVPMMRSRRTLTWLPVEAHHGLGLNLAFVDFLIAGPETSCAATMLNHLLDRWDGDVLILKGPLAGGDQDRAVREVLASRGVASWTRKHGEIVIDAGRGLDAYLRGRSAKLWSNVRYNRRRLDRAGTVEIRRVQGLDGVQAVLEVVFDVSRRSWKAGEGTAVGQQEPYRRFFAGLLRGFGATGDADVWLLHVNDRPIAYRFGVRHGRAFLECDIAYDQAFAACSPGTVLAAASNEALVREGVAEINLGADFPWKHGWSPQVRWRREFVIFRPGRPYARLLHAIQTLRGRYEARRKRPA